MLIDHNIFWRGQWFILIEQGFLFLSGSRLCGGYLFRKIFIDIFILQESVKSASWLGVEFSDRAMFGLLCEWLLFIQNFAIVCFKAFKEMWLWLEQCRLWSQILFFLQKDLFTRAVLDWVAEETICLWLLPATSFGILNLAWVIGWCRNRLVLEGWGGIL